MFELLSSSIDLLADTLRVAPGCITTAVILATIMSVTYTSYRFTESTVFVGVVQVLVVGFWIAIGYLPLWIVTIPGIMLIGGVILNGYNGWMLIATLIGMMIAIVVGVTLIPIVTTSVESITEETEMSSGLSSLLSILPYIFVGVVVLGAVAWMGNSGEGIHLPKRSVKVKLVGNSKEYILGFERESRKLDHFLNNLDSYLGIDTSENGECEGLLLEDANKLYRSNDYHWFLVDKSEDEASFKVVGLHKKDLTKNKVYLLGKDSEEKPYLVELPSSYIEQSWIDCKEGSSKKEVNSAVLGALSMIVGAALVDDLFDDRA